MHSWKYAMHLFVYQFQSLIRDDLHLYKIRGMHEKCIYMLGLELFNTPARLTLIHYQSAWNCLLKR